MKIPYDNSMAKQPEKMESVFSVAGDYEITCNVLFHYYPGTHGSHDEPPEPATIEIAGVEYVSGARNELEEEGFMVDVKCQMADEDFLVELEEALWAHIRHEEERAQDAYWESLYEEHADRALMAAQEEDS